MNCPSCSAALADGAGECASCGIIIAKWREREERRRAAAEAPAQSPDAPALLDPGAPLQLPDAQKVQRGIQIGAAAVSILVWALFLIWRLHLHAQANRPRRATDADIGSTVDYVDPATGEHRKLKVERAVPPAVIPGAETKKKDEPIDKTWIEPAR